MFHSRPGALAAEFARLMACSDDADALLAALDAVNHLSGHPHLAAAFAPLVPAAAARQTTGVVDELITTLVLGLAGEDVVVPQRGKGWLRPLRHRVSSLLRGTATPVSAATHRGGWLDPMVFVQRMLNNPDAPRDDVIDALLRLAPDNRREAFRLTSGLSGPYAHAVFYALGGSVDLAPTWVNMAAARARRPDALWTLAKRLPWLGLRYETELEGSIRDTPHRMVASPYDVDRVEADVASFLLHTPELRSGPAELAPLQSYLDHPQVPGPSGAALIAVALASPDDELAQLGIDITLTLFDRRLLGPRRLGTALRQLGADRDRVDTVLDVVAMEHPDAVAELVPLLRQMA
ncbi:hypothetical protein [Actinocrispum sp. NPDC049592]|uniref:hypothetical protein n=1 Tax=Actinocrispum sp. NPDC049592 TaxID=3154835 RepID=UPI00341205E8